MPKLIKKKTKKPRRNPQSRLFMRKRFTRFTLVEIEEVEIGALKKLLEPDKSTPRPSGYSRIVAKAAKKKKEKPPTGTGSTGPRIRIHR
ncbi:MAG: hypothetical protein KA393_03635 [Limnohabitans sp.]|nr:hypothetical protein [Limnohabitans sp.]